MRRSRRGRPPQPLSFGRTWLQARPWARATCALAQAPKIVVYTSSTSFPYKFLKTTTWALSTWLSFLILESPSIFSCRLQTILCIFSKKTNISLDCLSY
jgi:hypothetical protein